MNSDLKTWAFQKTQKIKIWKRKNGSIFFFDSQNLIYSNLKIPETIKKRKKNLKLKLKAQIFGGRLWRDAHKYQFPRKICPWCDNYGRTRIPPPFLSLSETAFSGL